MNFDHLSDTENLTDDVNKAINRHEAFKHCTNFPFSS